MSWTEQGGKLMITSSVNVTSSDLTSTHTVVRTEMEGLGQGNWKVINNYVVNSSDVK